MGNFTSNPEKRESPSGSVKAGKKQLGRSTSLTRSVSVFGTSIVSNAIPIESDKNLSVRLTEVHSSSILSPCVEVSIPFTSNIDSSGESSATPKNLELECDLTHQDEDEVDLAQLNMLQILQAESPQNSFLTTTESGCNLHKPLCLSVEAVDGETPASDEEDSDTVSDKEEERKSTLEEEIQGEDFQHDVQASEVDSSTHCEVYTVRFGGVFTYSRTSSPEKEASDESSVDRNDSDLKTEQLDEVESTRKDSSPSHQQELDAPASSDSISVQNTTAPFEMHTIRFGGLVAYSAAPSSPPSEENQNEADENMEHQHQTDQDTSNLEQPIAGVESSNESIPALDRLPGKEEAITNLEVYNVSFRGVYSFSATPPLQEKPEEVREEANNQAGQDDMGSSTFVSLSSSQLEEKSKADTNDGHDVVVKQSTSSFLDHQSEDKVDNTHCDLYTARFCGVHTFCSTQSSKEDTLESEAGVGREQPCQDSVDGTELEASRRRSGEKGTVTKDTAISSDAVRTPHAYNVFNVRFGGLRSYTINPPSMLNNKTAQNGNVMNNHVGGLRQPTPPSLHHQPEIKVIDKHCDVYAARFCGVHTFSSTQSSIVDDFTNSDNLESEVETKSEPQSRHTVGDDEQERSSLATREQGGNNEIEAAARKENCSETPAAEHDAVSRPYEVFNIRFGGLHSFTIGSQQKLNGKLKPAQTNELPMHTDDSEESQAKSQGALEDIQSHNEEGEPSSSSDQGQIIVHNTASEDKDRYCSQVASPHHQVYTVKFGGLYAFTATPSLNKNNPHLKVHLV